MFTQETKKQKQKQKISLNKFKPVLECKQVDNNNLKIFLKDQNSQREKKKHFWNSEN